MINISSLAEFKRFLAQPGATVQLIKHDGIPMVVHPNVGPPVTLAPKPGIFEPRTVKTLQHKSVQFSNDSWLQFGKAGHYRFDNGDTVTIGMMEDAPDPFVKVMVYKLSITE